jgi:putative hydrolase of the HAD superfamily
VATRYIIPNRVRGIVFDLDNTLVDAQSAERIAAIRMLKENTTILGEQDPEDFASRWHEIAIRHYRLYETGKISLVEQRRRRMRDIICDLKISDEIADRLYDGYHSHFEKNWKLYPDALPCLRRLRDLKMAVVSNGEKEQQLHKMNILGIDRYFVSQIFPSDTGTFKPDPRMFIMACQKLGVLPQHCLSVGDNPEYDIQPCKSINMEVLLLDRQGRSSSDASCPVVSSLDDIGLS